MMVKKRKFRRFRNVGAEIFSAGKSTFREIKQVRKIKRRGVTPFQALFRLNGKRKIKKTGRKVRKTKARGRRRGRTQTIVIQVKT